FFQAEDGIRDDLVTGVQTCALPICGVDIVIESVGGALTGEALSTVALNGVLTSIGYSAGRKTTIDVTDLIWRRASMSGFSLFAQDRKSTRLNSSHQIIAYAVFYLKK